MNEIHGTRLNRDKIAAVSRSIEFVVDESDDDLKGDIPSFRPDSKPEIDVIEEIARMHGYGNIERTVPRSTLVGYLSMYQMDRRTVRSTMASLGLDEVMPVPFLAPGDLEAAGLPSDGIILANPLVAEESVMRASLRPGILKTLAYNASHRMTDLGLFEVGHVYRQPD